EGVLQALDERGAVSVDDILADPQLLQREEIVLETEQGGVFHWRPLDKEQFKVLWQGGYVDPSDPGRGFTDSARYRPMLRALLLQSGYQAVEGAAGEMRLSQVALSEDLSLASILGRELPNKAWALRDFDAAAKFISMADAYGNALGGNYDVFRARKSVV